MAKYTFEELMGLDLDARNDAVIGMSEEDRAYTLSTVPDDLREKFDKPYSGEINHEMKDMFARHPFLYTYEEFREFSIKDKRYLAAHMSEEDRNFIQDSCQMYMNVFDQIDHLNEPSA